MNYKKLLPALLILFIAVSCKNSQTVLLPAVTGNPGDVILVLNESNWKTAVGEEFRKILEADQVGLPQPEPLFNVTQIPHDAFGNVFKSQRNILVAKISPDFKEPKIIVQKDLWAKPQIVINIVANNDSSMVKLLRDNQLRLVNYLENMERDRLMNNYKKNQQYDLKQKIEKEHHITLTIPNGYKLAVDTTNFVWLNQDLGDVIQGVLIYYYPYTDPNTFSVDYLMKKRDEFVKKYVPGEIEGSYMTTEHVFKPVLAEYKIKDLGIVAQLRGLWKMKNGISMGGPFVSLSAIDTQRDRVVTVEGFVFAPGKNKINLLRQVEAVVYSMKIDSTTVAN